MHHPLRMLRHLPKSPRINVYSPFLRHHQLPAIGFLSLVQSIYRVLKQKKQLLTGFNLCADYSIPNEKRWVIDQGKKSQGRGNIIDRLVKWFKVHIQSSESIQGVTAVVARNSFTNFALLKRRWIYYISSLRREILKLFSVIKKENSNMKWLGWSTSKSHIMCLLPQTIDIIHTYWAV